MCAKMCFVTGKDVLFGNYVSHSHRKTRRKFNSNLKTKRVYIPSVKAFVRIVVSPAGLRNIDKRGVEYFL